MRRTYLPVSLLLFASLAGCATENPLVTAVSCPTTAVLAQAHEIARYDGAGRQPANLVLTAEMRPAMLDCDYELNGPQVVVDLTIPIDLRRGPAGGGAQNLTYFVAVIDPNGNMISKRTFQRILNAGPALPAVVTEYVNGTSIGLAANRRPVEYEILTGFQLTPEEFASSQAAATPRQ